MTEQTPIVVNPSPVKDQVMTATRDITLILAAIPALIALLGKRDVIGIVNYLASAEGSAVLGMLVAAGVVVWRQLLARRANAKLQIVAEAAPNRVAIVDHK
ncbi:MAG: hypothetical protein ABW169_00030 [Sphingobium sp.]